MNRDEQQRALEGILDSLNRARQELDGAASRAHEMRSEADVESPFSENYLDEDLCGTIENLRDDVGVAAREVEWMLDDLDEGGAARARGCLGLTRYNKTKR